MKPNTPPTGTLQPTELGPGEHAADRLAHYIKMSALYPLASERVQLAASELLEAVTAAATRAPLTLKFHEDSIRAGREVLEEGSFTFAADAVPDAEVAAMMSQDRGVRRL